MLKHRILETLSLLLLPFQAALALFLWLTLLGFLLSLAGLLVELEPGGKSALPLMFLSFLGLGAAIWLAGKWMNKYVSKRWPAATPAKRGAILAYGAATSFLLLPALGFVWAQGIHARQSLKMHQSEAKIALAQLYQAEKAFKEKSGSYSLSLRELDYAPEGQRRRYVVAFPTACLDKEGLPRDAGYLGAILWEPTTKREQEIQALLQEVRGPDGCGGSKEGFEAYAVGVLKEGAPLDVWRIDEKKQLENVRVGY